MNTERYRSLILAEVAVLVLCFGPLVGVLLSSTAPAGETATATTSFLLRLHNSALVAGGGTVFSLAWAVPLAFLLFRLDLPGGAALRAGLVLGSAIPLHVYVAGWLGGLGYATGQALLAPGGPGGDFLRAMAVTGLAKVPLATVLLGLCLWIQQPELEEDAWLSTSRLGVLLRVGGRELAAGSLIAGSVVFGLCAGEVMVTDLLAIRTLAEELYARFQLTLDAGRAARAGMSVLIPLALPLLLTWRSAVARNLVHDEVFVARRSAVFQRLPRPWTYAAVALGLTSSIVVLALPFFQHVRILVSTPGFWKVSIDLMPELAYSLLLALVAGAGAIALAFPIVLLIRAHRARSLVLLTAGAGMFVPGSLLGVALVFALNRGGWLGWIYSSPLVLAIAQMLRVFPLTLLLLWMFQRSVPAQVDEMADLEGAGLWQRLLHVDLPLCGRPLFWSWLVSFLVCFGEFDASVIVCPPGLTPLPVRVFSLMHYGVYGEVAAACVWSVMAVLAVLLAAAPWMRRPAGA